jgi:peptide/nickel transport system substrate-binding protein
MLPLLSRRVLCATAAAAMLACSAGAALAATPKDTLVLAFGFDDIITMDPAEAFELSAGEIMGNTYDRLLRLDVNDPSKLVGDVAKSWTSRPTARPTPSSSSPASNSRRATRSRPKKWRIRCSAP